MTSLRGPHAPGQETQLQTLRDVRRPETGLSTFEEERREVLASVLESLAAKAPDSAHTAACLHLLRHLASSNGAISYR